MSVTEETRTPTYILGEHIEPGDTLLRAGEHLLIYQVEQHEKQDRKTWVTAWCTRATKDYRNVFAYEHVTIDFLASAEFLQMYNEDGVRALHDTRCAT